MRTVTTTEKYRAVNEGAMSPKEFVRQMRLAHPQHISQFNGYDDTVQILKNRGLLFETSTVKVEAKKAEVEVLAEENYSKKGEQPINYSLDTLDRGIRVELETAGVNLPVDHITEDDYNAAYKKAKANLDKNANHYLDLISGNSDKVDKHDKAVEVTTNNHVDTFNGLKKATLKEGFGDGEDVTAHIADDESDNGVPKNLKLEKKRLPRGLKLVKENLENIIKDIKDHYKDVFPGNELNGIIEEFIKMHHSDLARGEDPLEEFNQFIDANYQMKIQEKQSTMDTDSDSTTLTHDCASHVLHEKLGPGICLHGRHTLVETAPGKGEVTHYDVFFKNSNKIVKNLSVNELNVVSMEEHHHKNESEEVAEKKGKDHDGEIISYIADTYIQNAKDGDRAYAGFLDLNIRDAVQDVVGILQDRKHPLHHETKKEYQIVSRDKARGLFEKKGKDHDGDDEQHYIKVALKDVKEVLKYCEEYLDGNYSFDNTDTFSFPDEKDAIDTIIDLKGDKIKILGTNVSGFIKEKKGKDHDGDGDIDGDDYKHAKDKAIKKAMGKDEQLKEAIKSIIKKTLINEAATAKLSDWGKGYDNFPGVKPVVNELENIVTEIEQFHDKMAEKIAGAFAKTSEFRNEEGLKIGAFISPSLEAAFKQDLRPVIKGGYTSKVSLPKVRTISKAEIDAQQMQETPIEEKESLFAPTVNGTLRENNTNFDLRKFLKENK